MTRKKKRPAKLEEFPAETDRGKTTVFAENDVIFAQGAAADALYKIQKGKIKLTVISNAGKEAVIAVLGTGDFFGEGCLAGQPLRMSTAAAMTECTITRLERATVVKMLQEDP